MKTFEATEQAYKNGYEQGKKDALRRNIAKEKLIDIITDYADFLPWETIDDMADSIMEKFATDNNVGDKWIPVTERLPKPFTPVLVYRQSFGNLPPYIKVDKMILDAEDTQVWTDEFANWKNVTTHWMPLPEPPKGE